MQFANEFILVAGAMVTFAIFAGVASSRVGAPLLLVFLALGMLAGEDGLGGIGFDDFSLAYLAGSIGLALILFDGGLRTTREALSRAFSVSVGLATLGVIVTAGITGATAWLVFDTGWPTALLIGAIVGSTDAAAVFFLLHLKGLRLRPRVAATLEVESGLNDPMAIFLTLAFVAVLSAGGGALTGANLQATGLDLALELALDFLWQFAGGLFFGVIGGALVRRAVNRLNLSPGLYPILAVALGLVVFGAAQSLGASGFLAIFLVGFTLGNAPHRATNEISRFSDGLAWLSQIVMFLMMGLLVTPTDLMPILLPSLAISAVLILVARPVATLLCLGPFGYTARELGFVSWVGLRGVVPIFLGTIPVLENVPFAHEIFGVVFIVVLTSLVVQGWTIGVAARLTGVELPPRPRARSRAELDLPMEAGRSVLAYTVDPMSLVARRPMRRVPLPAESEIISVMREGAVHQGLPADGLKPDDFVLLLASGDKTAQFDRLFGARRLRREASDPVTIDFELDPQANAAEVAGLYDFGVTPHEADRPIADLMRSRLGDKNLATGAKLALGPVELVVLAVEEEHITRLGVDLEPALPVTLVSRLRMRAADTWRSIRDTFFIDSSGN
ncbi:potassium/proton antiporter [Parvibaculum sp. MBR-TMA-1.3b-4.2]|jgi:cell volume regulation protein A